LNTQLGSVCRNLIFLLLLYNKKYKKNKNTYFKGYKPSGKSQGLYFPIVLISFAALLSSFIQIKLDEIIRNSHRDSNHRSPVCRADALTTMLQ
jgi:hypothetical protein